MSPLLTAFVVASAAMFWVLVAWFAVEVVKRVRADRRIQARFEEAYRVAGVRAAGRVIDGESVRAALYRVRAENPIDHADGP